MKWKDKEGYKYPFTLTNDEQKVLNKLQKAKKMNKQSDKESSEEDLGITTKIMSSKTLKEMGC